MKKLMFAAVLFFLCLLLSGFSATPGAQASGTQQVAQALTQIITGVNIGSGESGPQQDCQALETQREKLQNLLQNARYELADYTDLDQAPAMQAKFDGLHAQLDRLLTQLLSCYDPKAGAVSLQRCQAFQTQPVELRYCLQATKADLAETSSE